MEIYKVLVLSTGHLTESDSRVLSSLAKTDSMIAERDTGYFLKLYVPEGPNDHNYRLGMSPDFHRIVAYATAKGFLMIEFDRDAAPVAEFSMHVW